jgi:hypothetical protein
MQKFNMIIGGKAASTFTVINPANVDSFASAPAGSLADRPFQLSRRRHRFCFFVATYSSSEKLACFAISPTC